MGAWLRLGGRGGGVVLGRGREARGSGWRGDGIGGVGGGGMREGRRF